MNNRELIVVFMKCLGIYFLCYAIIDSLGALSILYAVTMTNAGDSDTISGLISTFRGTSLGSVLGTAIKAMLGIYLMRSGKFFLRIIDRSSTSGKTDDVQGSQTNSQSDA